MSKLGLISHFFSPVSCDSWVLQGLRCEWGAGLLNLVLSLSLPHTGHWKFNMAPHGKELSENLKKIIVALHKDGKGYKKIAKTLKLSGSTVVKAIQWFNRTGSTQNKPSHGRPNNLCFISRGSVWEIDVRVLTALLQRLKGQPVSAQNTRCTLHQIDLHGCCMDVCSRWKPLLKIVMTCGPYSEFVLCI